MEKLELSPVELMQALNWKKSKVYYWVGQGKFETVQRLDGQKIVISSEDIERLKKSNSLENPEIFETVSEFPNNSDKVQQNSDPNITKNYKNVSNNLNSDFFELFNNSLETIKQIHQSSLNNFGYTTRLLTDGNNALEKEIFELKAEVKTAQARLEKSEKDFQESFEKSEQEFSDKLKQTENEYSEKLELLQKKAKRKNIAILVLFVLSFVLLLTVLITVNKLRPDQSIPEVIEQTTSH